MIFLKMKIFRIDQPKKNVVQLLYGMDFFVNDEALVL